MLGLAAAFYLQGRHAGDYERLSLSPGSLRVELRIAERTLARELDPACVRLAERASRTQYRLALVAPGGEIEIGRHLDTARRRRLAASLRGQLAGGAFGGPGQRRRRNTRNRRDR